MKVKTNNVYMTAKLTSTGAIIPQVCIVTIGRNDYEEDADNA